MSDFDLHLGRYEENVVAKKHAKKPTASRRDVMRLRAIRNPNLEWSEEEGQIVLFISQPRTWKLTLLNIFVPVPRDRRVVLDAIGTDVWKSLDGETTFESIARELVKKHQILPREAEVALQQFYKELGKRGYIGFMNE